MFGKGTKRDASDKEWFVPKGLDNPPVDKVKLGDIIRNRFKPTELVNADHRVPPDQVEEYEVPDSKWERVTSNSNSGGLTVGVSDLAGVELSADRQPSLREAYEADRVEVSSFTPDKRYLAKCLQSGKDATIELVDGKGKTKLYMVTDLRKAYGATKTTQEVLNRAAKLHVGAEIPAAGLSIGLGPKAEISRSTEIKTSAGKRDFLLAYKLVELTWNKKQGQASAEPYTKGASYADNTSSDEAEEDYDVAVEEVSIQAASTSNLHNVDAYAFSDGGEDHIVLLAAQ